MLVASVSAAVCLPVMITSAAAADRRTKNASN